MGQNPRIDLLVNSFTEGTLDVTIYFLDESEESYSWTWDSDRNVSGSGLAILSGKSDQEIAEFENVESFSFEWTGPESSDSRITTLSGTEFELILGTYYVIESNGNYTRYSTLSDELVWLRPLSNPFLWYIVLNGQSDYNIDLN